MGASERPLFLCAQYDSKVLSARATILSVPDIPLEYHGGFRIAPDGGERARRALRAGKTVFVIGAGASEEVKLPAGSELKQAIARRLDIQFENGVRQKSGDFLVLEAMRTAAQAEEPPSSDVTPYLHAGRRIRDALPQVTSIDHLLEMHAGDRRFEQCAKIAIVRSILEAEAKSDLYIDQVKGVKQLEYSAIEATWFNRFWKLLTKDCRVRDLPKRISSIVLVVFNYDRCLEHFLYYSFQNLYGIGKEEAAALVRRFEIFHPYGTVGSLPWLGDADAVPFGATPNATQIASLASRIRTFTEGTGEISSEIATIRTDIRDAGCLVFLGFAFHPMNLDLLMPVPSPVESSNGGEIYGTALASL